MPDSQLLLLPEAEAEIADAFRWYNLQTEGLGDEFLRAVEACLFSVEREPMIYPIVHNRARRALVRKFPYGIFFVHESNEEIERIIILACFHTRRDPKNWQSRTT